MSRYYFAYGSCMDYQGRIKKDGMSEELRPLGIGLLSGYSFKMNKLSQDEEHVYANIVPDANGAVYGALYRITERAAAYLDRREGYPRHYDKQQVTVFVDRREYSDVIVYIACPQFVTEEIVLQL